MIIETVYGISLAFVFIGFVLAYRRARRML